MAMSCLQLVLLVWKSTQAVWWEKKKVDCECLKRKENSPRNAHRTFHACSIHLFSSRQYTIWIPLLYTCVAENWQPTSEEALNNYISASLPVWKLKSNGCILFLGGLVCFLVLNSITLFYHAFFSLSASPLSHQVNSGVLSKAFPQVVSLGQSPTPLSLVQLQQEGEDIFIGLRGDISMATAISRRRVA